jgi:uncharacterized membrane protein
MSNEAPGFSQGSSQNPPEVSYTPPSATPSGLTSNVAAGLAYITIIPAIIFLVLAPYNRDPLVRFHSFQSIFLSIGALVIQVVSFFVLHFIPIIGSLLGMLIGLCILAVWIIALIQAFQGKYWKVPLIGDFAAQQAGASGI